MPNELIANPISGRSSITIEQKSSEKVERGSERKALIHGVIRHGEHEKKISLLQRKPDAPQIWIKNWRLLKRAGLPVPPTLRQTPDGSLLVTNLKANGAEMYGRGTLLHAEEQQKKGLQLKLSQIDQVFLSVIETELPAIEAKAKALVKQASDQLIILPNQDIFEVLMEPDGSWQLIIADLDSVFLTTTVENAQAINTRYFDDFIDNLKRCQLLFQLIPEMPAPPPRPQPLTARMRSWLMGSHHPED